MKQALQHGDDSKATEDSVNAIVENFSSIKSNLESQNYEEVAIYCQYIRSICYNIEEEVSSFFIDQDLLLELIYSTENSDQEYKESVFDMLAVLSTITNLSFLFENEKSQQILFETLNSENTESALAILRCCFEELDKEEVKNLIPLILENLEMQSKSVLLNSNEVVSIVYAMSRYKVNESEKFAQIVLFFLMAPELELIDNILHAITFQLKRSNVQTQFYINDESINKILSLIHSDDTKTAISAIELLNQMTYKSPDVFLKYSQQILPILHERLNTDDEMLLETIFDALSNILVADKTISIILIQNGILDIIGRSVELSFDTKKSALELFINIFLCLDYQSRSELSTNPLFTTVFENLVELSRAFKYKVVSSVIILINDAQFSQNRESLLNSLRKQEIIDVLEEIMESNDDKLIEKVSILIRILEDG